MKNIDFVLLRKSLIKFGLKYQQTKKTKYLKYLSITIKPVAAQMFSVIYNFLLKASMLSLLKDYSYSNNQCQIESFLSTEVNKDFYIIKEFFICIMDSRLTFANLNTLDLTFTKEFVNHHDYNHVCNVLEFIKNKEELRDCNHSFESHIQSIEHTINFYKILEETVLDKIESKVACISKALNVMHNTGYCFFNFKEIDNFLPVFSYKQKDMFGNISVSMAERELKKLL